MRTSFHHQPEAQHPNFQLPTAGRPITPSLGSIAPEEVEAKRSSMSASPASA